MKENPITRSLPMQTMDWQRFRDDLRTFKKFQKVFLKFEIFQEKA